MRLAVLEIQAALSSTDDHKATREEHAGFYLLDELF